MGLGTYLAKSGEEAYHSVIDALGAGYRSVDTAMYYFNEASVGQAIRESGIPRKEIYVTTKLWNDSHGYEKTLKAFDASLKRLGLDYIDEYLIHWPNLDEEYIPTWKAFEKLYRDGLIRVIGLSNFLKHTLINLIDHCEIKPMVNQIEVNPVFQPDDLITFCQRNDILVEAWRPLVWGKLDREPIVSIAKKYGKTPVQVTLRWLYQKGIRTLPKTTHKERMLENKDIFDFALDDSEIAGINKLNTWVRTGESPDAFLFMGEEEIQKHKSMGY
jgi:diketogulonate reductase-like aldo/keto reductase